MRTEFLCISVLRVASGPRSYALIPPPPPPPPPPVVCSKAVVPVLVLLLLCGLFYEAICCMSFRVSFCSCVFPSF